jgi:hypothetical protein
MFCTDLIPGQFLKDIWDDLILVDWRGSSPKCDLFLRLTILVHGFAAGWLLTLDQVFTRIVVQLCLHLSLVSMNHLLLLQLCNGLKNIGLWD